MNTPWDFTGKTVLVTGAASGIGLACARAFALGGARVFAADLRFDAATRSEDLVKHAQLPCDVTCEASVRSCVAAVVQATGRIDATVHCAGVLERMERTIDQDLAEWERVMAVNLRGTYLCAREVGRVMVAQRSGSLVTIGSVAGMLGMAGSNAYGPGKAAVAAMTRNLAVEWARHGVRVNCIAPGWVHTRMTDQLLPSSAKATAALRQVPLGRIASPDEIASAALFLSSDHAGYITGTTLPVDGGWSALGVAGR